MEDNKKIVKVYSNNSKKARIKRNKNKFQRIWDAEKQTYIKVRKAKYPVITKNKKKEEPVEVKMLAIKRRKNTSKKKKSVPVNVAKIEKLQKPETKQTARKEQTRIHKKITIHACVGECVWDSKNLRYKKAA